MTLDRYLALIGAYLLLMIVVVALCVVRGPVREAAWSEPCATLTDGGYLQGRWDTIEPCSTN